MAESNRTNFSDICLTGQLNDVLNKMQTLQDNFLTSQGEMNRRLFNFKKSMESHFKESNDCFFIISRFFDLSDKQPEQRFKSGLAGIENQLGTLNKNMESQYSTINKRLEVLENRSIALDHEFGSVRQRFDTIDGHLETLNTEIVSLNERVDDLDSPSDAIEEQQAKLDPRFDAVDRNVSGIYPRFTTIEQSLIALKPRLDKLEQRLDALTGLEALRRPLEEIKQRFEPLQQHIESVRTQVDSSKQSVENSLNQRFSASDQCLSSINGSVIEVIRQVQGVKTESRAGCLHTHSCFDCCQCRIVNH